MHETDPDYYEGTLSAEASEVRQNLEERLNGLYDVQREQKGIARLKTGKLIERLEERLSWQGANPKHLDFRELRVHIREALGEDALIDRYRARIKNRTTAIRAYCVECQGGDTAAVRDCPSMTCPLYSFRMERNPFHGYELPKVEDPFIELDDDEIDEFEEGDDNDADDT